VGRQKTERNPNFSRMIKHVAILVLLTLSCSFFPQQNTATQASRVTWNRASINLEFIAAVLNHSEMGDFLLSNTSQGIVADNPIYISRTQFPELKSCKAVALVNQMGDSNLIHFNHYYLGLYYTDLPEFKRIQPLPQLLFEHASMDSLAIESLIQAFENELRIEFKRVAKRIALLTSYKACKESRKGIQDLEQSILSLRKLLRVEEDQLKYHYIQVQGIPTTFNFGPNLSRDYYFITGNFLCPQDPNFRFNTQTAIHEFGHSHVSFLHKPASIKLVNSLSNYNTDELKRAMRRQGQSDSWKVVFEEHLVRAIEIQVLKDLGQLEEANNRLTQELTDGIAYIEAFATQLQAYKQQREYKSLTEYFPKLILDLKRELEANE